MKFIKDALYLFAKHSSLRKRGIEIKQGVRLKGSVLEGLNRIGMNTKLCHAKIGRGSYFGSDSTLNFSLFGRYCSVGDNVRLERSMHPSSRFISTHPAFYSIKGQAGFTYVGSQKFQELVKIEGSEYSAHIGNDVWIGSNVTIMAGITIADGCIIASNAVLTKNTSPYEVWGGVPARCIKKRFSDSVISELIALEWWNKDEEWIMANADHFENISGLKKMLGAKD